MVQLICGDVHVRGCFMFPCAAILTVFALAVPAAEEEKDSETIPQISIALKRPTGKFNVGKPIRLTATVRNETDGPVEIRGFDPEAGYYSIRFAWCARAYCVSRGSGDATSGFVCIPTYGSVCIRSSTVVYVDRYSGVDPEPDSDEDAGGIIGKLPCDEHTRVLGPRECFEYDFDLSATQQGECIDRSPGGFQVCVEFTTFADISENSREIVPSADMIWSGSVRSNVVEVEIIDRSADVPSLLQRGAEDPNDRLRQAVRFVTFVCCAAAYLLLALIHVRWSDWVREVTPGPTALLGHHWCIIAAGYYCTGAVAMAFWSIVVISI
jgi:hypothetical protein